MSKNTHEENINKQGDEIEALSSIYGTDFHLENSTTNSISVEINESEKAVLKISLPPEYPTSSPPTYSISAPWLKGFQRQKLSGYLEDIYLENIGESVIYLWVERIRQFILEEATLIEKDKALIAKAEALIEKNEAFSDLDEPVGRSISKLSIKDDKASLSHAEDEEVCPQIFSGEIIADRKSSFQPHLAEVHSIADVKHVLKKLYENKKIANATHNMYAYRFCSSESSAIFQDCDDDGETNAGGRMLHLLQILDSKNVLVVVSRWYGGIQLGPDRFKHINNAARQILLRCGYIKNKEDKKKKTKKK